MALRVLLADESTTIKKVMLLALQDFAVEVKAVHVGVDVLEVARSFKPDIIFVDVLLQKKNGYEVSADLKNDPSIKSVPVVLMWSSFMDLDKNLVAKAAAEGKLEKPFDVETLRKLVLDLVPSTRSQRLAHFLEFSGNVTEPLRREANPQAKTPPPTQVATPPPVIITPPPIERPPEAKKWSMENFEDLSQFASRETEGGEVGANEDEAFAPMQLTTKSFELQTKSASSNEAPVDDEEPWSHQDLSRFKVDLPPVSVESDEIDLQLDVADNDFTSSDFLFKDTQSAIELPSELPTDLPPTLEIEDDETDLILDDRALMNESPPRQSRTSLRHTTLGAPTAGTGIEALDADTLEQIIRAQSREIIEAVVRRVVPDLATTIIREELERLLADTGKASRP